MPIEQIKGFKVTNSQRSRICGVACKTRAELLKKAIDKFQLKTDDDVELYLDDGTVVDDEDYFVTVPPQTCFILVKKREQFLTGADIIYNALCSINVDTLKTGLAAKEFLLCDSDRLRDRMAALSRALQHDDDDDVSRSTHLKSLRKDDPAWFHGLDTSAKCKESFMRRRCGERMRAYLYKAERDVRTSQAYSHVQRCADTALKQLKCTLARNMNMGHYFDRSADGALCDSSGRFVCDGLWNKQRCNKDGGHSINPYSSREQRIIFSTWNLDHRIEKSREVIPSLIMACKNVTHSTDSAIEVNTQYFFSLLFTRTNLRIVHVVCHDKTAHSTATCDPALTVRPANNTPSTTTRQTDLQQQQGVKRKLNADEEDLSLRHIPLYSA